MLHRVQIILMSLFLILGAGCSCEPEKCGPNNCSGCCNASGQCDKGNEPKACGEAGATCNVCAAPQTCAFAACSGGGTINSMGSSMATGRITYDFVPSRYSPASMSGGLEFAMTVKKPLRNAVVRVMSGTAIAGFGVTDDDGKFSFGFNPGTAAHQLTVLARTTTPPIQVEDNTDRNAVWALAKSIDSTGGTVDIHATHGWLGTKFDDATRNAAPFAILDSMYTASKAFITVRPAVAFPPLRVNWSPSNSPMQGDKTRGQISTSHFAFDDGEIYVLGREGADTDEFDSHVIVHEWGHFFEFNLARSDSPGGRHGPGDILDPRIAFGEAFGNAVASMVLPETTYADSSWRGSMITAFGFDTETEPTPTDDPTPSAFSESSVLRALFDLYDTPSDGTFDQLSLGLGPIYDVLTGHQKNTPALTTMGSFITGLKAQPGSNAVAIDNLLAHYRIGAITSDFGTGDALLLGMYVTVPQLPFTGSIDLGGGSEPNSWQQNQYYVFTGNGSALTLTAQATQDVALKCYQNGKVLKEADATTGGTETISLNSESGKTYVLVLTGFGTMMGDYPVNVGISQ
jgi:hypothetical protein